MTSRPSELGVYTHYPWCRNRCPYCDFAIAVAPVAEIPHTAYTRAILDELRERAPEFGGRRLASIYFGGGTPSLWPPDELAEVIAAIKAALGGGDPDEVTLEANPSDCTPEAMAAWRRAGIGRLSIGVQSFGAGELALLGRDHRMGDGARALAAAAGAGFSAVSADLIVGAPARASARDRAARSVARAAELGPQHLSVYELTIEPKTPLGAAAARGDLVPLPDDDLADLYVAVHDDLTARGYEHYEVSSYARPGFRAVHNSLYWRGGEYLGLGNGAASFRLGADGGGTRWTNHRSVGRYLGSRSGERVAEREILTADEIDADRIWLGMRTADGVPEALFDGRPSLRKWVLDTGLGEYNENRIRPTLRGFLHADALARRAVGTSR